MSEATITDCDYKLSNGKRVDFWTVVRTILEKNPGCRAKKLVAEVRARADRCKSTLYPHLESWILQGKCFREKGKYYLPEQWYRHKRELEHSFRILRMSSKWNILQERLDKVGGYLLDLEHRKLTLGDQDPITGWRKENYDRIIPIQGIIVDKGAVELAAAVPIVVPEKYNALLLTPSIINQVIREDDQIYWPDKLKLYKIKKIKTILDGYESSYIIAMLKELRHIN